uniref:Uncharacterized protein n=1 Tax=Anopheles farauti TaxID=69004 RepID=A0A182Q104_9DIPT
MQSVAERFAYSVEMQSLLYWLVAIVLLGCPKVRADFGIAPTISGASIVQQYTQRVLDETNGIVSAYGDITLDGPVPEFNEAAVALKAVLEQVVIFVQPIAQSLGVLARNSVGPVETLFGDVDTKIGAMLTFISGQAQTLLATVEAKVSVYVKSELSDLLTAIRTTITELRSALSTLRTAVISARTNRATNSNVQTYVKPSQVLLVQTKTLQLYSDLPQGEFTAIESARTINQANIFVQIGLSVSSGTTLSEFWEGEMLKDYQRLADFLGKLKLLVDTEIPLVNQRIALFAQTFGALTTPIGAQYTEIGTVFGKITSGTDGNVLNAYKTIVSSAMAFIQELLRDFFPPIEPSIMLLAKVLIQRGPNGDYCFETYFPKIEQYLLSGEMTVLTCLSTELDREKALVEALLEVIYQLHFFLEDTNAYLQTCYRLSKFDTPLANECLQEHTQFNELIPCTAIKEYATMLQLLCKGVDSLRYRLWACLSRDTIQFPLQAQDIFASIEQCRQSGAAQG